MRTRQEKGGTWDGNVNRDLSSYFRRLDLPQRLATMGNSRILVVHLQHIPNTRKRLRCFCAATLTHQGVAETRNSRGTSWHSASTRDPEA